MERHNIPRREALLAIGAAVVTAIGFDAIGPRSAVRSTRTAVSGAIRLTTRPHAPKEKAPAGTTRLNLGTDARDGWLQVPASYDAWKPSPFVVFLHGATQSGQQMLGRIGTIAGDLGIIVLAPDSRDYTWDMMRDGFGPDIAFIDRALDYTFNRCNIDPARMALAGFSDGASYALSVGMANGDLFPNIFAFSPGFVEVPERNGKPAIFITHGTRDQILNIDQASRRIVPSLRQQGYEVDYNEFDGPHTPPPDMLRKAFSLLARH